MYSTIIHAHLKSDAELAEIASKYNDVDFRPYESFFQAPGADENSLKKHSYAAMFYIFIMMWRRVILLFTAMFLTKHAWL